MRPAEQQSELENGAVYRVGAKFSPGKVVRETSRAPVRLAGRIEQRAMERRRYFCSSKG